jgi:hypothetical protein
MLTASAAGSGGGAATAAVRGRLSTKSPYRWRVPSPGAPSLHAHPDPPGYEAVALYLVARHGSRWPTLSRTNQMHGLAPLLRVGGAAHRGGACGGGGHAHAGVAKRRSGAAARHCCNARMHACAFTALAEDSPADRRPKWLAMQAAHTPLSTQPRRLQMVNPRMHPWVLNFSAPLLDYTAGELHPMGGWGWSAPWGTTRCSCCKPAC